MVLRKSVTQFEGLYTSPSKHTETFILRVIYAKNENRVEQGLKETVGLGCISKIWRIVKLGD